MVELPTEVKNMATTTPAEEKKPAPAASQSTQSTTERPPHRQSRPFGNRPSSGGSGGRPAAGGRRSFNRKRRRLFGGGKVCQCCVRKIKHLDYKDTDQLKFFVSGHGRILPRRMSGTCARHQRLITTAVKRARNIALLPFKT